MQLCNSSLVVASNNTVPHNLLSNHPQQFVCSSAFYDFQVECDLTWTTAAQPRCCGACVAYGPQCSAQGPGVSVSSFADASALRFTVTARDRFGDGGGNADDTLNATVYRGYGTSVTQAREIAVTTHQDGKYVIDYSAAVASYGELRSEPLTLQLIMNPHVDGLFVGGSALRWCAPGTRGTDSDGFCAPCAAGQYAEGWALGADVCSACDGDTVTSPVGAIEASACVCIAGFYFRAAGDTRCEPCPFAATCAGGRAAPRAVSGYQVDPVRFDVFHACPNSDACEYCTCAACM